MEKRDELAGKVDEVMESLDGIHRADPGPWFFTRLSQRLRTQPKSVWVSVGAFLSRPAIAISGIAAVLMLNLVLLLNEKKEVETASLRQPVVTENDYITASTSSFEYENLVQP
jgi:hypothetical protein